MKTLTKKIQPLAVLVVLMAFFLTSCDQVLEAFYPEFGTGKSFSTSGLTLTLTVDKTIPGNIVVGLVPYDFNSSAGTNGAYVANLKNFVSQRFTTSALDAKSQYTYSFTMLPGTTYRLIAFVEDDTKANTPAKSTSGQANSYIGTVLSVNQKDLFTSDDAKSAGGKVGGNLGVSTKLPIDVYYELFGTTADKSQAFKVNSPLSFDNVTANLNQLSLYRPFDYGNTPVIQVEYDLTGPSGFTAVSGENVTVATGQALGGDIFLPSKALNAMGSYRLTVYYWLGGASPDNTNLSSVHRGLVQDFYVADNSGATTSSELANGTHFTLKASVSGLSAGQYGQLYYLDPWGNYVTYGTYVDSNTTGEVVLGDVSYYSAQFYGAHGQLVLDVYSNTGGFLYRQNLADPYNEMYLSTGATSLTKYFALSSTLPLAQGSLYTINFNLDASNLNQYGQTLNYGDVVTLYVYNNNQGYYPYYANETFTYYGGSYLSGTLTNGHGTNQDFYYTNDDVVWVYVNGLYVGTAHIQMNAGSTVFTVASPLGY